MTPGETIGKTLSAETADRIAKYFYAPAPLRNPYEGAYGDKSKGTPAE